MDSNLDNIAPEASVAKVVVTSRPQLVDTLEMIAPSTQFPCERHRWNTNEEIASILISFDRHESWFVNEVQIRPRSGTITLYNRKRVRYRRDGFCWKKRKDGKTTREDHMKLKVQGTECIYGCYVHSALLPTFHRRCYWLLQNPDIVLVHYLNVPFTDDNKMMSPTLNWFVDSKKDWTKQDLIQELKPMFYTPEDGTVKQEGDMTTDETIEYLVNQLMDQWVNGQKSNLIKAPGTSITPSTPHMVQMGSQHHHHPGGNGIISKMHPSPSPFSNSIQFHAPHSLCSNVTSFTLKDVLPSSSPSTTSSTMKTMHTIAGKNVLIKRCLQTGSIMSGGLGSPNGPNTLSSTTRLRPNQLQLVKLNATTNGSDNVTPNGASIQVTSNVSNQMHPPPSLILNLAQLHNGNSILILNTSPGGNPSSSGSLPSCSDRNNMFTFNTFQSKRDSFPMFTPVQMSSSTADVVTNVTTSPSSKQQDESEDMETSAFNLFQPVIQGNKRQSMSDSCSSPCEMDVLNGNGTLSPSVTSTETTCSTVASSFMDPNEVTIVPEVTFKQESDEPQPQSHPPPPPPPPTSLMLPSRSSQPNRKGMKYNLSSPTLCMREEYESTHLPSSSTSKVTYGDNVPHTNSHNGWFDSPFNLPVPSGHVDVKASNGDDVKASTSHANGRDLWKRSTSPCHLHDPDSSPSTNPSADPSPDEEGNPMDFLPSDPMGSPDEDLFNLEAFEMLTDFPNLDDWHSLAFKSAPSSPNSRSDMHVDSNGNPVSQDVTSRVTSASSTSSSSSSSHHLLLVRNGGHENHPHHPHQPLHQLNQLNQQHHLFRPSPFAPQVLPQGAMGNIRLKNGLKKEGDVIDRTDGPKTQGAGGNGGGGGRGVQPQEQSNENGHETRNDVQVRRGRGGHDNGNDRGSNNNGQDDGDRDGDDDRNRDRTDRSPGQSLGQITDYSPEWSYTEGGMKVLVAGPWFCPSFSYNIIFDGILVPTSLIQSGVLRCFSPAHEPGFVSLQVAIEGSILSNAVIFEYRDHPSTPNALGQHAHHDHDFFPNI